MTMIGDKIKIKYIGEKSHGDFERGKWYDAYFSKNRRLVMIVDKSGDGYGYPPSLFEIKEEMN